MKITTVGIDLAKNVFQVHGVDERGKAVLRKRLGSAISSSSSKRPESSVSSSGSGGKATGRAWAKALTPSKASSGWRVGVPRGV